MAKDKKKKAEQKQRQALKMDKKALKSERKTATNDEDDLEQILQDFKRMQAERVSVYVEPAPTPSPRSNATLVTNPLDPSELFLFGGEAHNGQTTIYFGDLFIYSTTSNDWKLVSSPNSPGPRSCHQIAAMPSGKLFMFGGEFSNRSETRYLAYRDFWQFNAKDRSWENLDIKPIPPPRCGHRVAVWRHLVVLHGGFYDTGTFTKYLDDTWLFCTRTCQWTRLETASVHRPSARSGFLLFPSAKGVYLYGGYASTAKSSKTTASVTYSDMWHLTLSADLDMNQMQWDKVKKSGTFPSPRAGMSVVSYKDMAIIFGGVEDHESDHQDSLVSTVYNDMYMFNMNQEKFYMLNMRNKQSDHPCPRFSPCMAVAKSAIYLYGGLSVVDDKQYTLGDMYYIRADKLDGWTCLHNCGVLDWIDSDCDSIESGSDSDENSNSVCSDSDHIPVVDSIESGVSGSSSDFHHNSLDPLANELLKDYYARTCEHWLALSKTNDQHSAKDLKRMAFNNAQVHYDSVTTKMSSLALN